MSLKKSTKKSSGMPIFKTAPSHVFKVFMPLAEELYYKAGKLIFKEGSSADVFFLIKEGEVEIRKVIERQRQKYHTIAVLVKGDFLGEMAVFLGQPRSADAQAKTDVKLLAISRKDLSALLKSNPEAAFRVMGFLTSVLMKRLDNTTKDFVTVYDTGRLITASRGVSELANSVMGRLMSAIGTAHAGLFVVWNEFNQGFEVICQKGFDLEEGGLLPEGDPLIKWFMDNKEAFLSFDLKSDQRASILEESIYRASSMAASPFFLQERLSGFMLVLNRKKTNAFSYNQVILLSSISSYVTVALENLRHMQEEGDRYRLNQMKSKILL